MNISRGAFGHPKVQGTLLSVRLSPRKQDDSPRLPLSRNMSAPTPASGRVSHFVSEISQTVANPDLGGTGTDVSPHERDLVAKLINDPENKELWQKLLNNRFCLAMKDAGKLDLDVLRGFEWYIKQDYHYVAGLVELESERLSKARTTADFERNTKRIAGAVKYTEHFFQMCTTTQPKGLGLSANSVLDTVKSEVLRKYIDLVTTVAREEGEVFSKVVTIAGLQSYAILAPDLYRYSTHQDTIWYKFWAEENYPMVKDALVQQKFFISHHGAWKDRYAEASKLFREACECELRLWEEAFNNSNPNA